MQVNTSDTGDMDRYRESRGSFGSASSTPKKVSNYGSDFLRLSKVIGNNIQKIQSNVLQMKTMLSDLEKTPEDTRKLSQLHEVQQKTNALVKDTGIYIQDLNKIPKSFEGTGQRQQRIQRERLVSEFSKTVDDFQVVQKQEKEKTKEQVVRDRKSVKRYKDSLGPLPEGTAVVEGQKGEMLMVQVDVTDIEMELMREREEELRKLEADIMDVQEIFRDLGAMIHEQQDVVDSIENNVEATAANVQEGNNQLLEAHQHQMKARKKKCIIIIIVSVVIVVIIIIIVLASTLS